MSLINDWRKRQLKYETENLTKDALILLQIFSPTGTTYLDQMKLVHFFKFLALTANSYQCGIEKLQYVNAVSPFVDMIMKSSEYNNIEDFVGRLTLAVI